MHGGDFLSWLRKGNSGAPRLLLQGCGRMLGVLSLQPGPRGATGSPAPSRMEIPIWKVWCSPGAAGGNCLQSPPPGGPWGDAVHVVPHTVHSTGPNAAVPSWLLPVRPRARCQDKAGPLTHGWLGFSKVGCSQHHVEGESCWVLLLFIASLVITDELKVVAVSLAVELPCCS